MAGAQRRAIQVQERLINGKVRSRVLDIRTDELTPLLLRYYGV